ncbi:MAG: amidophosphoribosyltransferase, partial [Eubacteriales bacterium]
AHCPGIPYGVGLVKNRYIGRTFIQPTQGQRERSVKIKLNALAETVRGKRVVMIDDSIVRGTTSAKLVSLLREAGATEVHMRISSPPFLYPCYFGTDVPDRKMLLAVGRTVEDMRKIIGVDSLAFLSLDAVHMIAREIDVDICDACFTGLYATEIPALSPEKYEQHIEDEA